MTAQGVLSSPTPAMNTMLSGFGFAETPVKGEGGSFEQVMEFSKGETDTKPANKDVTKQPMKNGDIRERVKELFSGESKVKEAKPMRTEDSLQDVTEATEAVATLMVQVRQVICEELGITEEQLNQTMEELGLTDADLLDRAALQELFLTVNQVTEPTELLTNEGLFDGFADLMQAVEQTVTAAEIPKDVVVEVLQQAELSPEEVVTDEQAEQLQAAVPEENTDTEEVSADTEPEEAKENPGSVGVTGQTETESKESFSSEGHSVEAKRDGNKTVISSEGNETVKDVFIDALTNYGVTGTGEEALEAAAQVREIANQIMEQIKIVIRPEQTNMELQLNPEHLGRVNLTITEKEGMMTAQFTTQTQIAKEAIESQMASLRESLQNQGIKVESIEVTVSEFGFERDREARQGEENQSGRQKRRNQFSVEEAEEAPKMSDYMKLSDSNVDYSA